MNKWAYLSLATGLVVVGCGGSGSGGNHSVTVTPGVPGTSIVPSIGNVNASGTKFGTVDFTYLTGQGRTTTPGDLTAVINHITLQDQYGAVNQALGAQANLPLNEFTAQELEADVPFTAGVNSRLFESYSLLFSEFLVAGESTPADPPPAMTFPSRIRVFPGRETEIPIFLDDSMFSDTGADPASQSGADLIAYNYTQTTPSQTVFAYRNLNPALATPTAPTGELSSYIGDYIAFDISKMPTAMRPQLVTSSGTPPYATKVFVSGDNFAVVAPTLTGGLSGTIQVLTENASAPLLGNYGPQSTLTIGGQSAPLAGTYDLTTTNPSSLTTESLIISLYGAWRDSASVMSGMGGFEMITFPSSSDNNIQEFVFVQGSTGVSSNGTPTYYCTNLYYGTLDTILGKFQAFPVADLVSGKATGQLTGTISNYQGVGGSVGSPDSIRYGVYKFSAGSKLPAGFQSTGTFAVFRV